MNKTAENEWQRLFLIECLPDPLTPASAHIQIFDNYIEHTRLRLRSVRDPYSKSWVRSLQQRFNSADGAEPLIKTSEIHLNDSEYGLFEQFEGREIRKNRYFHEYDRVMFAFDVYLGPLWGLNIAKAEFGGRAQRDAFEPPPFALYDVTADAFFDGASLVDLSFADVQKHVATLTRREALTAADE